MSNPNSNLNDDQPKEWVEDWLKEVERFFSKPTNIRFVVLFVLFIVVLPLSLIFILPGNEGITSNQVGDTFGGVAGPIITLLSSVIIYFSLVEQVKANKIQFEGLHNQIKNDQEDRNFQFLYQELKAIENRFQLFEWQYYYVDSKILTCDGSKLVGFEATENFFITILQRLNKNITSSEIYPITGLLEGAHLLIDYISLQQFVVRSRLNTNDLEWLKDRISVINGRYLAISAILRRVKILDNPEENDHAIIKSIVDACQIIYDMQNTLELGDGQRFE